ncbi:acyltransferase [Thauera sp. 2A1]|uniref:acyltransferase family protein n=1 Tax=Thauera sp. 2A1 TaxID=2570191 RepID=UPI001292A5E0|nr:acyltransferase [Thauera sp. 2A1]KAI5914815.1 acyltransferase [Thauera sp. 2A1]
MNEKILGFDGLRGISVLFVIASHAEIWSRIGGDNAAVASIFSAHVGVSIFFVLSGSLITHLLIKEKKETGSIDLRAFYARRALRIFPLYYLAVFFRAIAPTLHKPT